MDLPINKETNDDTDVFNKGIASSYIIYDCLKNLGSKVNEICELSSSATDAQIKDEVQMLDSWKKSVNSSS